MTDLPFRHRSLHSRDDDTAALRKGTNADAGVSFLAKYPDEAFIRAAIRTVANIPDGSVRPV